MSDGQKKYHGNFWLKKRSQLEVVIKQNLGTDYSSWEAFGEEYITWQELNQVYQEVKPNQLISLTEWSQVQVVLDL